MSEKEFSPEQQAVTVPFFLHENEMTRMERVNKRLWIALLVIFVALIGTNAGWIVYESQFETYYYSQDVSSDNCAATALLNTGEGDINYNGDQDKTDGQNPSEKSQPSEPDENMPDM